MSVANGGALMRICSNDMVIGTPKHDVFGHAGESRDNVSWVDRPVMQENQSSIQVRRSHLLVT